MAGSCEALERPLLRLRPAAVFLTGAFTLLRLLPPLLTLLTAYMPV